MHKLTTLRDPGYKVLIPASLWRVFSIFPPELADGVINCASNFITQFTQFITEWKSTLVFIPLLIPFGFGLRIISFTYIKHKKGSNSKDIKIKRCLQEAEAFPHNTTVFRRKQKALIRLHKAQHVMPVIKWQKRRFSKLLFMKTYTTFVNAQHSTFFFFTKPLQQTEKAVENTKTNTNYNVCFIPVC